MRRRPTAVAALAVITPFLLLIAYAILLAPHYLNTTMTADETDFRKRAVKVSWLIYRWKFKSIYYQPADLGYGSGYWLYHGFLTWLSGKASEGHVPLMRLSALIQAILLAAIFPIEALRRFRRLTSKSASGQVSWPVWLDALFCPLLALALWLSSPIAWWHGKLTGPETPSMTAAAWGTYLAFLGLFGSDRPRARRSAALACAGAFLLGFGAGIKMNAAPVAVGVFGAYIAVDPRRAWRERFELAGALGFGGLGFVVASPVALFHFMSFARILKFYHAVDFAPRDLTFAEKLTRMLWADRHEWDAIPSFGLSLWSAPLALWPLFLYAIGKFARRELVVSLAIILALLSYLIFANGSFLGWYWFPLVVAFAVVLGLAESPPPFLKAALIAAVACTAFLRVGTIRAEFENSAQQTLNEREYPAAVECVKARIKEAGLAHFVLYDFSETTMDFEDPVGKELGADRVIKPVLMWGPLLARTPGCFDPAFDGVLVVGDRMIRYHERFAGLDGDVLRFLPMAFDHVASGRCGGYLKWYAFKARARKKS